MAARSITTRHSALWILLNLLILYHLVSTATGATLHTPPQLNPNHQSLRTLELQHVARSNSGSWRGSVNQVIQKIIGYPDSERSKATTSGTTKDGQSTNRLHTKYGDDVVLRFEYSTAEEAIALAEACDTLFLDVWAFAKSFVDVRLSRDTVLPLLGLLPESLQHAHTPIMQELDLAQAVYNSYPQNFGALSRPYNDPLSISTSRAQTTGESNIFFQDFQPLTVIHPWMRLLASLFPSHVRMIAVGRTHEDRDIYALKIGVRPSNPGNPPTPRKTMVISGGIHAREWIGTSSVNYAAYFFATMYGKSSVVTSLVESFDWVFIPTTNPDGYTYTWNEDRLWRKNRQPGPLRFCSGIDLDRSYGYHWDGAVTSDNPCSENFAGEQPLEARETRTFVDWVRNETQNNNVKVVGFLDLHSYSQEVLYPYSYSCTASPPSLENLQELAIGLAKAIRLADGHYYKVISACQGNVFSKTNPDEGHKLNIPQGGGSALDWFYGELGVNYAFQIKLRDTGTYGFLLPKEHIIPSGKEVVEAILYFGKFMESDPPFQAREEGPSGTAPELHTRKCSDFDGEAGNAAAQNSMFLNPEKADAIVDGS
ncbi:MAG: putative metallocarboxypeptidase ecm14 [Bogoriella megaspora]|nr:MAG: putative metallocarboxypeptidase ecm14 [Bogoriella megaspora]